MQSSTIKPSDTVSERVPLVVNLEGTLIPSDFLVELSFTHIGRDPSRTFGLLTALLRGKTALKSRITTATELDAASVPYNVQVIERIQQARAAGCPVYLASASDEKYVDAIAAHLKLFDGWFASSAAENLSSPVRAERLVQTFGAGGFDYIGNSAADLAVWSKARQRTAVRPSKAVERKLLEIDPAAVIVKRHGPHSQLRNWLKLLRIHQWVKNLLVFVPLGTSQNFDLPSVGAALVAFVTFSFAASGTYLINDLVDLDADRKHVTKRHRPLAAGTIPLVSAIIVALILFALAVAGAVLLSLQFTIVLLAYLALTNAYTFVVKRKMVADVVTLASLYTLRVVGGAAAIAVPVSEWLLAFSMFIFVALALIKRYTELAGRLDSSQPDPTNRNYRKTDLDVVAALAAASGFNAITVFTLYISSDTVRQLYAYPQALWLICPILMYWIGRILMLAHRRLLHDDPVVFALRDPNSLACAIGVALAILLASIGIPIRF